MYACLAVLFAKLSLVVLQPVQHIPMSTTLYPSSVTTGRTLPLGKPRNITIKDRHIDRTDKGCMTKSYDINAPVNSNEMILLEANRSGIISNFLLPIPSNDRVSICNILFL